MRNNPVTIRIKKVYEDVEEIDGRRILVDRLWPRGLSKQKAKVDVWLKDVAPSTELRQWYGHDPDKWDEFRSRYAEELKSNPDIVGKALREIQTEVVTFVYSSKEERLNNAVALKEYIESII